MRIKLTLAALVVAVTISLFLGLNSCSRIVKNEAYYQQLAHYIYAFSNGNISKADPIRVRFVNAAVSADQVGQPVSENVFSIVPAVKGQAKWEDDRTIVLQPTEPLEHGKNYRCNVEIGDIYEDAPNAIHRFDFSVHVRELSFDVITEGLAAADMAHLEHQKITGLIRTTEPVDPVMLEKVLAASQSMHDLQITWNHTDANQSHYFVVNEVARSMKRSAVKLAWNGKSIGIDKKGKTDIPVPSLDEFKVLSVRVDQKDNQCIVVNFSDPLNAEQDLNGLVTVANFAGTFRFSMDGNNLRAYPSERIVGEQELTIGAGVKNNAKVDLGTAYKETVNFEDLQPGIRLVGRGAIIPGNSEGNIIFPFEAVGLNAIDVEIFKIYNSNILQFLQVNELEGSEELARVGKIVYQKKFNLSALNAKATAQKWQRYALDLKDMIKKDPTAIYQVRIVFRKSYVANLNCTDLAAVDNTNQRGGPNAPDAENTTTEGAINKTDEYGNILSLLGGYRGIYWNDEEEYGWYYDDDYNYDYREDPCHNEYYNRDKFVSRNVFVSDLGLTAKLGRDHSVLAIVTDLNTTDPVNNVDLEFFNYQLQSIGTVKTGRDGAAIPELLRDKPFIMVAKQGNRRGYLRMADGSTLSLSRFDVAGIEPQKGLKGYIYGERGVWRPGDSVYLNFVLEDRTGKLPPNHPVSFDLIDVKGTLRYRTVVTNSVNGVYPIHFATSSDAPTGSWMAKVEVGGAKFSQAVRIETVKPNRLKLDLNFGKKSLSVNDADLSAALTVNWLHGATAKNLKAKVEMQLVSATTTFPNFKDFTFEDPAKTFYSDEQILFDGQLDDMGKAKVPFNVAVNENAPGKLIANFKIRAFEEGGDFSVDNASIDYYPFPRMVGVKVPTDKYGNHQMEAGKSGTVEVACVDNNGKPLANQTVEVGLYRCDWRWWWDQDRYSDVGNFNSGTHVNAINSATLKTDANGHASWKVTPANWGRYLVRVTDGENGHAAGNFFWCGYPDRADDLYSRNAAAMLPLTSDKEKYNVGETVSIKVPASGTGRVLVTLENGERVVKYLWFDTKAGDNILTFKAEAEMTPSVYAHVSLLQPHAQTKNDLPIRMYGVVPINIENPVTYLHPIVDMPDVLKPGEAFTVKLKEQGGKACAYTLAIVDEGLLDLTRFKTPNPHDVFFAREGLGVKTWDIYDYVLGVYGVELERILNVGGDAFNRKAKNASNVNRFKPAVIHVGPFYLDKGQTASHTLTINNYVGSVRVMAVMSAPAANAQGAYGSAEKTCPVRKPLMILPTLPRVLGPGETVRLPVQVFAMEKSVKSATLRVREPNGNVIFDGSPTQTLTFSEPGDKMAYYEFKVGNKTGLTRFTFEAQGGGETATDEIELLIRNPMPYTTQVWQGIIAPGKEWDSKIDVAQFAEIEDGNLEVSALPPMNFSRHLQYLIRYPHGCLEQTTSAAFPQLFADMLTPLSSDQQKQIAKNVSAAINKIKNQQDFSGGFNYWPGGQPEPWSTSYAGHFLLESKAKGYAVPDNVIDNWVRFQTDAARNWSVKISNENWYRHDNELNQAYRLYTLAMAGKSAIADMNRLREVKTLYEETVYLLAASYAQLGKPEVARELIQKGGQPVFQYDWCGYTYGSDLRDRALILEAYTLMGETARAESMVNYISTQLTDDQYSWGWSTQSLATAMRALSKYATKVGVNGPSYTYKSGSGSYQAGSSNKAISVIPLNTAAISSGSINVKNTGSVKLYARLVISGQNKPGIETPSAATNITLDVTYKNASGQPVNVQKIAQGSDFVAVVKVTRNSSFTFPFNELSLSQIFPSGWEITNSRMGNFVSTANNKIDYQDIRDDRVLTYFDLLGDYNKEMVFEIQLNAAYKGHFYLPTVVCEAMYDSRIRASASGMWVDVL